MKKVLLLAFIAACSIACLLTAACATDSDSDVHTIILHSSKNTDGTFLNTATVDEKDVAECDYCWHADPSQDHAVNKDSPAEYYTGTTPDKESPVYIAHDIFYYPELPESGFQKVNYDGEQEWAYYYTAPGYEDYIFATLPVSGSTVPKEMMHSAADAYQNAVLHITEAGTYILKGEWHGQIWIDLGDPGDTYSDESAKVNIILDGVKVDCTVAPALIFYSAYESDNAWESQSSWSATVDTTNAGANVILADGSVNEFNGTNVYRMLKAKYKDDSEQTAYGAKLQKKARKTDGAFYSYVSMNVYGEEKDTGVLKITGGFEGLDTEHHLTINGGNINVFSQDDGINVNEDRVSVVTFNGGNTHILAGLGREGDGIDSNGYLVVNGGTLITMANPNSDSGMDSDCGTYVNGGSVVALGSTMDWAESSENGTSGKQATMNLQFSGTQSADEAIIITEPDGPVVFAYDPDKDEVAGANARWYRGAIVSSPQIQIGESYTIFVGGDIDGSETAGVYDISTIKGYSGNAKQQCYSATGEFGRPGGPPPDWDGSGNPPPPPPSWDGNGTPPPPPDGMGPGMQPPPGWNGNGGNPPVPSDGSGQGMQLPPDGVGNGNPSAPPDGSGQSMQPPPDWDDNGNPPPPPGGMNFHQDNENGPVELIFKMEKAVNGFSGVRDLNPATAERTFQDVSSNDWYYDAVKFVAENGLMNGTSDTKFSPFDAVTRGMFVVTLYRLEGLPAVSSAVPFADVKSGEFYSDAITWAADNKLINGYGNGSFGPNDLLTRQQLVTILYRYAEYKQYDISASQSLSAFADQKSVQTYAKPAMEWALAEKLMNGTSENKIEPSGTADRAQLATFLMRFSTTFVDS